MKSLVPVLLISSALLAGCSAADVASPARAPSAAASVTPSPLPSAGNLCEAWDGLRTSITDLRSINIVSGGVAAVQTAVNNIQTQLDAFQSVARTEFGPQVTDLRSALSTVSDAVKNAAASPGPATILPVVTGIAGVVSAYNGLKDAVSSRCS
jgi:hypothetical protein